MAKISSAGTYHDDKGRFISREKYEYLKNKEKADPEGVAYDPRINTYREVKTGKAIKLEEGLQRETIDQEKDRVETRPDIGERYQKKKQKIKPDQGDPIVLLNTDQYAYYDPKTKKYYAGRRSSVETGKEISKTKYKQIRAGARPYVRKMNMANSLISVYDEKEDIQLTPQQAWDMVEEFERKRKDLAEQLPDLSADELDSITFQELEWVIAPYFSAA